MLATMPSSKPWVQAIGDLDGLALGGDGRVVLTHPGRSTHENLGLGQVIDWALKGATRSFNVVVGYFNHQDHETGTRRRSVPAPADVVAHEVVDERGRSPNHCAFRLLFGKALTPAAAHVLRSWYWLCRWRHAKDEEGRAWRRTVVDALDVRLQRAPAPHPAELAAFAWHHLAERGSPFFDEVLDAGADHVARLLRLNDDELERFEKWRGLFIERNKTEPVLDLLLYFVRSCAAVRVDATTDVATVHPKIYVIERSAHEERSEDAIVLAGSGNWSAGAFGRTASNRANVEVSTVHRIAALGPGTWDDGAGTVAVSSLGSALAATAAQLFADGARFASWDDREMLSPREIDEVLQPPETTTPEAPEAPPETPTPEDPISPILRSLIERTLGLGDITSYAYYERVFGRSAGLWGGRKPSRYQLDGALRVLSMLEGASGRGPGETARAPERGAFLTDEPGLGKTLIGQIVVATLASERLRSTHAGTREDVPVRVSIIAPARIAGREGSGDAAATGWHAAAEEIRQAVRQALTEWRTELPGNASLDPSKLTDWLEIRVLSATSFGRHIEADDDGLVRRVADDWFHVARSEIVVVDESHNFRNGDSAATRALRFLLTLPVPGEQWPLLAGEIAADHGEKAAAEVATEGDRKAPCRKVLCLSATPFNNRLEDFITQIAHFARYQAWSLPVPGQLDMFGGLRMAITDWNKPGLSDAKRRAAFDVLAKSVVRHLRSGRRLDDDEIKAEARERNEKTRRRPEDEGPLYDWAFTYDDLRRSFAQVAEWLQGYLQGESSPEDESDARARVDALLARLVIQRSRRRILGMMQREGTLKSSFRAPNLPRHPLAIGVESNTGKPTFEAKVLAKLYDLLPSGASSGGTTFSDDRLNLFSYEIGVRRGREESRIGGTDETAIRNAVGFQATGLIKRLQSSPYAFLRTLARGPLRRALFELAVVEAIGAECAGKEGALAVRIVETAGAVAARGERLRRSWGRSGEAIAGLLGGAWKPRSQRFFQELVDVTSTDQRNRFDFAKARVEAALQGTVGKGRARSGGTPEWLDLLLADLGSKQSKLWIDVDVALAWILDEGDEGESIALLRALYRHLDDDHVGLPMVELRRAIDSGNGHVDPLERWLASRLRTDRRAGWILGVLVALAATDSRERLPPCVGLPPRLDPRRHQAPRLHRVHRHAELPARAPRRAPPHPRGGACAPCRRSAPGAREARRRDPPGASRSRRRQR